MATAFKLIALLALPICLSAENRAACISVAGDRIRGTDLIRASSERYKDVDPNLDLGLTPVPGLTRLRRPAEVFAGLCFERATEPLTRDSIEASIKKTLGTSHESTIDILDFSRIRIPASEIEFPAAGLLRPPKLHPDQPVFWRGRAVYGTGHSIPIWARVKIAVRREIVEAANDIPAGRILVQADLAQKTIWTFPLQNEASLQMSELVGMAASRKLVAGEHIDLTRLATPTIVEAGQTIDIQVVGPGAQLRTTAIAERSGKLGDTILARNDRSGRRFRAKVTGPKQALVVVPERL